MDTVASKQFMADTQILIVIEIALLLFCEFGPLTNFKARKLCHTGSGFMMLALDPADCLSRYFVYSVVLSSLIMVWEFTPFTFRFSRPRDVGITVYLLIVGAFFYGELSLTIITPVFFADP